MRSRTSSKDWLQARNALEKLVRLNTARDARIEIGRVTYVGEGSSRRAYTADINVVPDANALPSEWIVLLQRDDTDDNDPQLSPREEQELLAALYAHPHLPFRVPRPLGALAEPNGAVMALEVVHGAPLDLRAGRQRDIHPWEVVATIAAAIHSLDLRSLISFRDAPATQREHGCRLLQTFEALPFPEARDTAAWAKEHLPASEPSSLLHADLLGQNILLDRSEPRPYAVIDWGSATAGDPAYDLAITTRGVRRPFQIENGLERLLEAYNTAPGRHPQLTIDQVRFHELYLAACWCKQAMRSTSNTHNRVEEARETLRRVLTMATSNRPSQS